MGPSFNRRLALCSMASAAVLGGEAWGQTAARPAAEAVLEEIIVTAEHRAATAQTTPIALTALTGESLARDRAVTLEDVSQKAPNVTFSRIAGNAKVFIRGVGLDSIAQGSDARVAIYTDGVYNARTQAALSAFYDVDRIEVLRGPQGTLYGRNATAGAVNIIGRDTTDSLAGYGLVDVGVRDALRLEGAVSGPLSDTVSARVAFQTVDRDGFGRNISTGEEVDDEHRRAVRGKVRVALGEDWAWLLSGDYSRQRDHNGGYRLITTTPRNTPPGLRRGGVLPTGARDTAGFGPVQRVTTYGVSSVTTGGFAGADLTSISAYRFLRAYNETNLDLTTADLSRTHFLERSEQVSQEFRANRSFGRVDVLAGLYFFREAVTARNQSAFAGVVLGLPITQLQQGFDLGGDQTTEAYAAFAQATIRITEHLGLDVGARYSDEKKSLDEYFQIDFTRAFRIDNPLLTATTGPLASIRRRSQSASWSSFDPKATLHYRPSENLFAYVTYATAFKSGGFNVGGLQGPFRPEDIEDLEAGVKARLFDRRVQFDLAAFRYDYRNLQVNLVEGQALVTRNAAKARLVGVEAAMTALVTDALRLDMSAGWLDAEYREYVDVLQASGSTTPINLAGNRLTYAPEFKMTADVAYTFDLGDFTVTPRVGVIHTTRVEFSPFNLDYAAQPARTEWNVFLDVAWGDGWTASAYVRNLTNDVYKVSGTIAAATSGFPVYGQYGPPRTAGVVLGKRFR